MVNRGKIFEQCFKNSVPKEILYERFKDGTANWGRTDNNVRFQAQNVCDCFLYDGHVLMYLELKSHKGKSIPLTCIRTNQKEGLTERQGYGNVICGLIVEFSDIGRVFYLNIDDFNRFIDENDRKSIPWEYFRDYGIEVSSKLMRTNYKYDIQEMFDNIVNRDL